MGDRAHLSIGEVLSLVQEDFPDITISKIRFLESQGLLDPERTPSGYRKFYDADIDRLQWILTQQRDHFLPLKVIRERLAEWDATGTRPAGEHQTPPAEDLPGGDQRAAPDRPPPAGPFGLGAGPSALAHDVAASPAGEPAPAVAPSAAPPPATSDDTSEARHAAASLAAASAIEVTPPVRPEPPTDTEAPASPHPTADVHHPGERSLTAEELATRARVDVRAIDELEGFGMIESHRIGPDTYYDVEHLAVVEACRAFLDHGVEVRHLRMYKIAAEREAGVLEQLIMPLLKQRNPEAKDRARSTVAELADAGEALHAGLLRRALRDTLP